MECAVPLPLVKHNPQENMALKCRLLLFAILPILVASVLIEVSTAFGGGNDAIVGDWRQIRDLNDPQLIEIAKFAVSEHNKQAKAELQFVKVVKGQTQVVAGTNYKIVIAAKSGAAAPINYEAVVWDQPWRKFRELTSFVEIKG